MSEPPGGLSAIGIEAVEWLAGAGENLTVRVRGRWRRGRPTWSGQSMLVIEGIRGRERFPATPEPPGLTGTGPGTWQMSFSVPASLSLGEEEPRAWLQLGAGPLVPLPVPVESAGEAQQELEQLRAAAEQERAARAAAEARAAALERELAQSRSRSLRAYQAIKQLRDELDRLRVPDSEKAVAGAVVASHAIGASPDSSTSEPTRPAHQDSARRPRLVTQLQAPRSAGRWLERALRQLARRSPSLAGRLLVVLVEGAEMDQERLVRLLAAGPLRRGRARALGESPSFDALKGRLAAPGTMAELHLEPGLSFALAAVMIDGRWTTGERFTIAYQLPGGGTPGPCLEVTGGAPVTVTGEADPDAITTTVVCPADHLPAVLSGQRPEATKIEGEKRPLELIRVWLERAQSD